MHHPFHPEALDFLDELAEAAEQLTQPEGEPIALSPELSILEEHLNWAHSQALRDQRAAREAEQRKNDLVVYLAHDLKTPLTSVIGYLSLLRDEPDLSPALRARYTGVALDKAERLEDLINEFFDITRFNLTHMELERRPCDLSRMLQQVCSEFSPMLEERGLACRLDLPEALPYSCDPDKLARVFDNLLRNACNYSEAGTAVEVSARTEAGEMVLTFTNTGATIPPDKLSRVFEQFFRLDASRASRTGGGGAGPGHRPGDRGAPRGDHLRPEQGRRHHLHRPPPSGVRKSQEFPKDILRTFPKSLQTFPAPVCYH